MEYITLQKATILCSYSQEYLSLRARQGKLKAVKIGRNWCITSEWLEDYIAKTKEYRNLLKGKRKIPKVEPPSNLPIYASDADIWEDGRPEEVARQTAFQRKLQFAVAFASVVVLLGAGILRGQQEVLRAGENVNPVVLSSAVSLQGEAWEKGFAAGRQSAEVGRIMGEYFDWLDDQIRGTSQ